VAEWLDDNLEATQYQAYGIVTNNTAECLFAHLCLPDLKDLAMRQMTAGPMICKMMELFQKQATKLRKKALASETYTYKFSLPAVNDFMQQCNASVRCSCRELKWICECGRDSMMETLCRHIIAVIKDKASRRALMKDGGIGSKWRS
jgi:hypothetical protein